MFLQVAFTKFWVIYSVWDFLFFPVYVIILLLIGYSIQRKRVEKRPEFKFFTWGLAAKMVGSLFFAWVYTFHYYGGDSTNYYQSSVSLLNVMEKNIGVFLKIMVGDLSPENFSYFDRSTGYVMYSSKPQSFAVVRFSAPFVWLGCKSYYLSTLILAFVSYTGIWKLFQVFVREFPKYSTQAAIGVLFMPSVLCWGSGIIKDSYMISALGWFVYAFYSLVKREKGEPFFKYYVYIIISVYVMLQIKAFNFYAMAVCIALWFIFEFISKIKNELIRFLLYPFFMLFISVLGMYMFMFLSQFAGGAYSSVNTMLEHAVVVQQDLTRDAYGDNSFDIGAFEPTLLGILMKSPKAIEAGLFRPYPWEANNFLMVLSAAENFFLLVLTIFVLIRVRTDYLMRYFVKKPYIMMLSVVFALLFAFSVGLVTANFGALVRYKIPLVPFYVTALLVIYYKYLDDREAKRLEDPH